MGILYNILLVTIVSSIYSNVVSTNTTITETKEVTHDGITNSTEIVDNNATRAVNEYVPEVTTAKINNDSAIYFRTVSINETDKVVPLNITNIILEKLPHIRNLTFNNTKHNVSLLRTGKNTTTTEIKEVIHDEITNSSEIVDNNATRAGNEYVPVVTTAKITNDSEINFRTVAKNETDTFVLQNITNIIPEKLSHVRNFTFNNTKRDILLLRSGSRIKKYKKRFDVIHGSKEPEEGENDSSNSEESEKERRRRKARRIMYRRAKALWQYSKTLQNKATTILHQALTPKPYELIGSGVIRRKRQALEQSSGSGSSASRSREEEDWKKEWEAHWQQKKFSAINITTPKGAIINMVAARPWGKTCGDKRVGAYLYGTCTLPMECEAELRIFNGDYDCGNTQFVCCGIQHAENDLYQGMDASFETSNERDRSPSMDTAEREAQLKKDAKRKKKRDRKKRMQRIKNAIKNIIKTIRKIVAKLDKNSSKARRWKTKQLQKFVKYLKRQYMKDRKGVVAHHSDEIRKIDDELLTRLKHIMLLNKKFAENATFREMIVTGYINDTGVNMLMEQYPDLAPLLKPTGRRDMDHGEYDLTNEYGLLYF